MEDGKQVLVPARFLSLALHLVASVMLFFSYKDNIYVAYPDMTSTSDTRFTGGEASFMVANVFTLICLGIEIVILFTGVNMFKERLNFILATTHLIGAILYVTYGFEQWQFDLLWALWAVFALIPTVIDIIASCYPQK